MNKPILLSLLLALSACAKETPHRGPLAGAPIGGPFALTDQNGHRVTDKDFAGRYRIMYFGYTYCPDVCPVDMQMIAQGVKQFDAAHPDKASKLAFLFVTVDPERDTPAVLKQYVANFAAPVTALTGPPAAIKQVEDEYKVFASKGPATPGGGYLVGHSRSSYLLGPDGKPIALLTAEGPPDKIAGELATWVQ